MSLPRPTYPLGREPVTLPRDLIAPIAIGSGMVCGALTAREPVLGVGAMLACFLALPALWSYPAMLACWTPAFFVPFWSGGDTYLKLGALLTLVAFAIAFLRDRRVMKTRAVASRVALSAVAALLAWLTVSSLWAEDSGAALSELWKYYLAAGILVGVVLSVGTMRELRLLGIAFLVGCVITAAGGLLDIPSGSGAAYDQNIDTVAQTEGRVQGGTGDANVLAAASLAAIALAGGLAGGVRSNLGRLSLVGAVVLLGLAAAGAQSRGGVIAALAALVAALAVLRRRRAWALATALCAAVAGAAWLVLTQGAIERLTDYGDQGDGRSELWRIALRMGGDHPAEGVGVGNYIANAPDYVLEPGTLMFVRSIVDRPVVAHNTFLEFFAETGFVGLALFAGLLAVCMGSMLRAANLFDGRGEHEQATFARCTFVATLALMVAGMFFSAGVDYKNWLLLSFGPVLLRLARAPRATTS